MSGIFVDITEQKAAEAEAALQRQELAHLMRVSVLGELSGAIAHEINQPLTAIQSNAETGLDLLAEKSPDLAEIRDVFEDIVHDNRRASEVIERLRNLLKKGERRSDPVDLNDLVNSTVALLNSELISRRINVKLDLAIALPAALGDPVQLQQVLLNLVMNAMDAMASTPTGARLVTISTRVTRGGAVEVLVRTAEPASSRGAGPTVRAVLHHQGPRPWSRLDDLLDDRRGARRESLRWRTMMAAERLHGSSLPAPEMLVAAK